MTAAGVVSASVVSVAGATSVTVTVSEMLCTVWPSKPQSTGTVSVDPGATSAGTTNSITKVPSASGANVSPTPRPVPSWSSTAPANGSVHPSPSTVSVPPGSTVAGVDDAEPGAVEHRSGRFDHKGVSQGRRPVDGARTRLALPFVGPVPDPYPLDVAQHTPTLLGGSERAADLISR